MKTTIKIVGLCLILMLSVLSFCACESEYSKNLKRVFETDYFVCINYEGEDTVTILELTKLGREQEVLIIPEYINGFKVSGIEGRVRGSSLGPVGKSEFTGEKTKKVYWSADLDKFHAINIANNVVYIIQPNNSHANEIFLRTNMVYALNPAIYFEKYGEVVQHVNCVFYNDDIPIWVDYIHVESTTNEEQEGNIPLYIKPADPNKENYEFIGWFINDDINKLWNGEYVLPEGEEELSLYAKFKISN